MEDLSNEVAVLVVSCDKYSDLWEPFFTLFSMYWKPCPFKLYLLSNREKWEKWNVTNLLVGEDVSWSDSLKSGLEMLSEPYVLMTLDDLFLCNFVPNDNVIKITNWALLNNVNHIRMNPYPKADKPFNNLVGLVSKNTRYRTSTVFTLWKRKILEKLLLEGESPWDFEIIGSERSNNYDGFYAAWDIHFPYLNGIIKAKWNRSAASFIKSKGIETNFEKREIMTRSEYEIYKLKKLRNNWLRVLPATYRQKLTQLAENIMSKTGIDN